MSISASLTADMPVETCSDRADSRPNMEYLFDRYSVGIYRYISLRVGRNQALADELMQQLWLQACKAGRGGLHILTAAGFTEITADGFS